MVGAQADDPDEMADEVGAPCEPYVCLMQALCQPYACPMCALCKAYASLMRGLCEPYVSLMCAYLGLT